jgi:hypothetical protein
VSEQREARENKNPAGLWLETPRDGWHIRSSMGMD